MIKEIKYGGITTTPSDYDSPDGDLASAVNLLQDGDRIVVPRNPDNPLMSGDPPVPIIFVHKPIFKHTTTDGDVHWISEDGCVFYEGLNPSSEIADLSGSGITFKSIDAIGNTLIIVMSDGVYYITYKDGVYISLGNHVPEMHLRFGLEGRLNRSNPKTLALVAPIDYDGQTRVYSISEDNIDAITKQIFGEVEKFMDEAGVESGMFAYPFFVRYGIRLYDGSYTNMSAPILMEANIGNTPVVGYHNGQSNTELSKFSVYNVFSKLKAEILGSLYVFDGWDDVVKGVDIFVSSQFQGYDPLGRLDETIINATNSQQSAKAPLIAASSSCLWVGERTGSGVTNHQYEVLNYGEVIDDYFDLSDDSDPDFFFSLPYTNPSQSSRHSGGTAQYYDPSKKQDESIEGNSVFYKLYSYDFKNVTVGEVEHYVVNGLSNTPTEVPSGNNILANIETQKTLPDDYFSHDTLMTNSSFVYNSRLTLGGVTRQVFDGFWADELNVHYTGSSAFSVDIAYHVFINENGAKIQADSQKRVSYIYRKGTKFYGITPAYFYYPNPNAFKLVVEVTMNNDTRYAEYDMKPHPILNGAYCLNRAAQDYPTNDDSNVADYSRGKTVTYPSQIYTSEAYNPYVFKAENINQLPISADIINMASTTQPMSQGQFGQYPLYVFSDMGIFALQLASNGSFSSLTPVTRDVILGDGSSLTQLDDSLLFATKQGIMELVGKNTKCITKDLDKKIAMPILESIREITCDEEVPPIVPVPDIKTFINGCKMVYDYVNARVIVFNPEYKLAYVYAAKDDAWTMMPVAGLIDTINAYPEAYAVAAARKGSAVVYGILDLSTITDPQGEGSIPPYGWLITRPFSLDSPNDFKFIDVIRQNGVFKEYLIKDGDEYNGKDKITEGDNVIRQILYGSNDLIHWFIVGSSDSRLLNGRTSSPFKWFRLAVGCTFKHGESLSSFTVSYRVKSDNPHLF